MNSLSLCRRLGDYLVQVWLTSDLYFKGKSLEYRDAMREGTGDDLGGGRLPPTSPGTTPDIPPDNLHLQVIDYFIPWIYTLTFISLANKGLRHIMAFCDIVVIVVVVI